MKQFYIGLAATVHDPAIAIIDNKGKILHAEALERPMQYKIAWDINPGTMFDYLSKLILKFHNDSIEWLIATSWDYQSKKALAQKMQTATLDQPKTNDLYKSHGIFNGEWEKWLLELQNDYLDRIRKTLPFLIESITGQAKVKVINFDHHLTHAANACYFHDNTESALCVVADGEGEVGSLSCFLFDGIQLKRLSRSWGSGSLGVFYGIMTNLCGFDVKKGEAWKMMGLAAYGQFDQLLYDHFSQLVCVEKGKFIPVDPKISEQVLKPYISKIASFKTNPLLAKNIAHTAQYIFEEVMLKLLTYHQNKTDQKNLILAGGCALNSRLNGKIKQSTLFETIFIPPAPGDDGNAVGAAALLFNQETGQSCLSDTEWQSPYLGESICPKKLKQFINQANNFIITEQSQNIFLNTAQKLAEGKLVAWVHGRGEFGPRALGNRSILANPQISNIKEIINSKIKFRESYRPFAPSIMDEYGIDWFEDYQDSPYMSKTLNWREEKKKLVPGVVHKDGTGRVQSVKKKRNPDFYNLISQFYQITGIPCLLNTSLNVMGKPIVYSLEDIIGVFMTTGIDILVIDGVMIEK